MKPSVRPFEGFGDGCAPEIQISREMEKFCCRRNESFVEALRRPLPFTLPVINMRHAVEYSEHFEFGEAEYMSLVDSWIDCYGGFAKSDITVVANDTLWQKVLQLVCGLSLHYNETNSSDEKYLRPNFVSMNKGMMVMKGEATWSSSYMHKAGHKLADNLHHSAHLLFPEGCPEIPGVVTSLEGASLHRIYCAGGMFREEVVKTYQLYTECGRVEFICDIMKLGLWIVGQDKPLAPFHLIPDVRIKTRSGHFITLEKDGLLKEFKGCDSSIQSAIANIRTIYAAKLPNVEQGVVHHASMKITRVGQRLEQALRTGILTEAAAITGVTNAVQQLHSIGLAHCDLSVENVFVDIDTQIVFVGGLERCRPLQEVPPSSAGTTCIGNDMTVSTSHELDIVLLARLLNELSQLYA